MLSPALIKKATAWRANRPDLIGGVIVFHGRELQGWVNRLRNPEHWVPGCIALDCDGKQYVATGGDAYNGAQHWEPITTKTKKHAN